MRAWRQQARGRATAWSRLGRDGIYIDEYGMRYTTVEALQSLRLCQGQLHHPEARLAPRRRTGARGADSPAGGTAGRSGQPRREDAGRGLPPAAMRDGRCTRSPARRDACRHAQCRRCRQERDAESGGDGRGAPRGPGCAPCCSGNPNAPRTSGYGERRKAALHRTAQDRQVTARRSAQGAWRQTGRAAQGCQGGGQGRQGPCSARHARGGQGRGGRCRQRESGCPRGIGGEPPGTRASVRHLRPAQGGEEKGGQPKPLPEAIIEHRHIHWSYEGEGAPGNWSKLDPKYATCATGKRQSPIDIREGHQGRSRVDPVRLQVDASSASSTTAIPSRSMSARAAPSP